MLRGAADLVRHNREFAAGAALVLLVATVAALSLVSPYPANLTYVVPPDVPPSWPYLLGMTPLRQDVFWLLPFAIRNTLLFGLGVAVLSRILSLTIGLVSGYVGGALDRVLMSVNDS